MPSATFDPLQFLNKIIQIDTNACASECMLCSGNLAGQTNLLRWSEWDLCLEREVLNYVCELYCIINVYVKYLYFPDFWGS